MKYIRIIPRLDIKGPNLVKGIHLEGLRVLGKPESFARLYYEQGADEIIYQDTVASLYQRNNLTEIVSRTAADIFIPITVGGGIRSLSDIGNILRSGADKVSINTAAIANPDFIDQASKSFGSSTIVVAVETIKQPDGRYLAYTDNGREHTDVEVVSWVREMQSRGAGEILLTSIDQEGTGNGFDIDLIKLVSDAVTIPVIAHGGAGTISHIVDSIQLTGIDAIAIASILHYTAINQDVFSQKQFSDEGNVEFIKKRNSFKMFGIENITGIKKHLADSKISIRAPY